MYKRQGLDSSPEMIAKARQLYPGMDFRVLDARLMPWRNRFDIVFSNAALHWIPVSYTHLSVGTTPEFHRCKKASSF